MYGGGKYNSSIFNDLGVLVGIQRQLTTPYSFQQNGVAKQKNWVEERKNLILIETILFMLYHPRFTKFNWNKAQLTTNYL